MTQGCSLFGCRTPGSAARPAAHPLLPLLAGQRSAAACGVIRSFAPATACLQHLARAQTVVLERMGADLQVLTTLARYVWSLGEAQATQTAHALQRC